MNIEKEGGSKAKYIVGGLGLLLLVFGAFAGRSLKISTTEIEPAFGAANAPFNSAISTSTDVKNLPQDVVGTHIGTTTVGVASPTRYVTTTYISYIGQRTNIAVYHIKVTAATTSANSATFTVQGTNDGFCQTLAGNASSTTDVVQRNITWYDAMNNLVNRVHPTSFGVGSSTAVLDLVNANADTTAEIFLTNLNYECLRFSFSASSTAIYVGLSTK